MPLPSDKKLVQLGKDIIQTFDAAFGVHPGKRPVHAKGILLKGEFRAAPEARTLTRAPHIQRESVPVVARFSSSTGLPTIPDSDPNSNPRGLAIRFYLAERSHTDIISHSVDNFPSKNGDDFLALRQAAADPNPATIQQFLAAHPETLAFLQIPKPFPASFARENYFAVSAFSFTNAANQQRYGRYRILSAAGVEHLDNAVAAAKGPDYLYDELRQRIQSAPIGFDIQVQIAGRGDTVDNATVRWPEDRPLVSFGSVTLTGLHTEDEAEQKHIIFDPIPRVDGIEPSADPLLDLRAAVYLLSGRRRREA